MKKYTIIGAITVILLAALVVAGIAYAQTQTPPDPAQPYGGRQSWGGGSWMMGRGGGMMGGGWFQRQGLYMPGSYGPMHESMIAALAQALDLTPEELGARHDAGESMWDIAQELGFSPEQFQAAMLQARSQALEQAVADGVLTQEQADWMLERMNGMWQGGYRQGAGGCLGMGGGFQSRPGGWR